MLGTEGEKYILSPANFQQRYSVESAEEPTDAALQAEGYKAYMPTGRCWAEQLDEETVSKFFPAGKFIAAWGSEMLVEPGDWIATPSPAASEVYRVEKSAFANTYALVE